LNSANWGSTDGNLSFSTTLTVPEIDDIILKDGAVIVYLSFDNGAHYEAIPEVFDNIAYGSVHAKGSVTLDIYALDGGAITPPGSILAKVVLIDAQALGN
jgi:Ni,Fe-hydrogenase III small subunit